VITWQSSDESDPPAGHLRSAYSPPPERSGAAPTGGHRPENRRAVWGRWQLQQERHRYKADRARHQARQRRPKPQFFNQPRELVNWRGVPCLPVAVHLGSTGRGTGLDKTTVLWVETGVPEISHLGNWLRPYI